MQLIKGEKYSSSLSVDVKGNLYKLNKIVVYDNTGEIVSEIGGQFQSRKVPVLKDEITRKLKVNYNVKENYIVKSENRLYGESSRYTLYLHKDLIQLQDPTYRRNNNSIYANYRSNLHDEIYFMKCVKEIDAKLRDLRWSLHEKLQKIRSYDLNSEYLRQLICELQYLQILIREEEIYIENYTVDRFIKEELE